MQDTTDISVVAFQGETYTRLNIPVFQVAFRLSSFRVGHVGSDAVSKAVGRADELVVYDPSVFRLQNVTLKAAQAYVYQGKAEPSAMEEWIWKRSAPLVGILTPLNHARYVRTAKPVLKLYLDRLDATSESLHLKDLHRIAASVTGNLAAAELLFALVDRTAHKEEVAMLWRGRTPPGVPFAIIGMTVDQPHLALPVGFSVVSAQEACRCVDDAFVVPFPADCRLVLADGLVVTWFHACDAL